MTANSQPPCPTFEEMLSRMDACDGTSDMATYAGLIRGKVAQLEEEITKLKGSLKTENEWVQAMTKDVAQLISENDKLRDNAAILNRMYDSILQTMQVGRSRQDMVEVVLDPRTGHWEKA